MLNFAVFDEKASIPSDFSLLTAPRVGNFFGAMKLTTQIYANLSNMRFMTCSTNTKRIININGDRSNESANTGILLRTGASRESEMLVIPLITE
jgi:hypothetical protein